MPQVNLSQVKAKVGDILASCGQQDVEKTCKWFLLWHNRYLHHFPPFGGIISTSIFSYFSKIGTSILVCSSFRGCHHYFHPSTKMLWNSSPLEEWKKRVMRAEISRLAGIVRTFINIQLSPEIFPPLAKGTFFQKENNWLKRRCEEKEENVEL